MPGFSGQLTRSEAAGAAGLSAVEEHEVGRLDTVSGPAPISALFKLVPAPLLAANAARLHAHFAHDRHWWIFGLFYGGI